MLELLPVVVLDKERHLRLGMRGMIEFEKRTGHSLLKGFKLDSLSMEDVSILIWACLIHEDKSLIPEAVQDLLDINNLQEIISALKQCIGQALPEVENKNPLAVNQSSG